MSHRRRFTTFLAALLLVAAGLSGAARASRGSDNSYEFTILVSNETGEAPVTDATLQNAWGIAASPGSPWWVADNGSNSSTLYTGAGAKLALEVSVPGAPTGIVWYGGSAIEVSPTFPARFLFATESGTILGWNQTFDMTSAHEIFNGGSSSIYKGLAVVGDTLFTTDFGDCDVEALQAVSGVLQEVETGGGFEDETIPDSYCPFGIQAIHGTVFVTYALKGGDDDVAGVGHGFVRAFDTDGHLIAAVASRGPLNSPWGLALAPGDFGAFGGCLLVGNFGDGFINAFCRDRDGDFRHRGRLKAAHGLEDIQIDGLWGLGFGNGAGSGPTGVLYFAAGPDEEANGYFGTIVAR